MNALAGFKTGIFYRKGKTTVNIGKAAIKIHLDFI